MNTYGLLFAEKKKVLRKPIDRAINCLKLVYLLMGVDKSLAFFLRFTASTIA